VTQDDDSGGNGFQHHRTGDALSRTTWMMALGAGVREGCGFRPPVGIDRSRANPRLDAGIFSRARTRQADTGTLVASMPPSDLKPEQFTGYPPEARKLVTGYVVELRRLPLSFLPSLLREVIEYDFKFPAERSSIEKELANLKSLSAEQIKDWFQGFAQIRLSSQLEHSDWVNAPGQFVEQLSFLSLDYPPTGRLSKRGARLRRSFARGGAAGTASRAASRDCRHRPGSRSA